MANANLADNETQAHLDIPIRCQSLVRVINPEDRFCLARAILIGLKWFLTFEQNGSSAEFKTYCANQAMHGPDARQLLLDAGISISLSIYGIQEVQQIQQHLLQRFGTKRIRLVIFSSDGQQQQQQQYQFKLIWKGWDDGAAETNICLLHHRNHFSFIGKPSQLFKAIIFKIFNSTKHSILVSWLLH